MTYSLFKLHEDGTEEWKATGHLYQLKEGRSAVVGRFGKEVEDCDGWITSTVKTINNIDENTTLFITRNSTYKLVPHLQVAGDLNVTSTLQ